MARKSIDLLVATPAAWTKTALDNFDVFLADHANCERKASALAMSLVVRYPDRTEIIPQLIELAKEELEHFEAVYELMQKRGLKLQKDTSDHYATELLKHARHGREERFIDRMLIASVIEGRSAERLGLIADAHPDTEIQEFYSQLYKSELKHAHVFVHMLLKYADEDAVYKRLHEINAIEADIMQRLELRGTVH